MARFLFCAICLLSLPGLLAGFWHGIQYARSADLAGPFWAGLFVSPVVCALARAIIPGYVTLRHELAHAEMAWMLFKSVDRFVVTTTQGGYVHWNGPAALELSPLLIALAPYFLCVATPLVIFFSPDVAGERRAYIHLLWGTCLGFHVTSVLGDTCRNWWSEGRIGPPGSESEGTDIERVGHLPALIVIIALNALIFGALLHLLEHDHNAVRDWRECIVQSTRSFYAPVWPWFEELRNWMDERPAVRR